MIFEFPATKRPALICKMLEDARKGHLAVIITEIHQPVGNATQILYWKTTRQLAGNCRIDIYFELL